MESLTFHTYEWKYKLEQSDSEFELVFLIVAFSYAYGWMKGTKTPSSRSEYTQHLEVTRLFMDMNWKMVLFK